MKTVSFTEFRSHASGLLHEVENGQTIMVLRHGRPVAGLVSVAGRQQSSWKRPGPRLKLNGADLARVILEQRA